MTDTFNNDAINPSFVEVLSPFLPGTNIQFAFDSTSLGYLKTCPRLYQYIMIDGWSSSEESIHLRFGIEYHKALEDYDKCRATGISHDEAVHDALRALLVRTWEYEECQSCKGSGSIGGGLSTQPCTDCLSTGLVQGGDTGRPWTVDETSKAGRYKNRESLIRTVCDYLDHFADDPARTYILDDGRPAVELSFRFELDWGPKSGEAISKVDHPDNGPIEGTDLTVQYQTRQPYLLSGHLDRVVTFQDQLFVIDRKTTTTTPSDYYFNQFEPNNQMSLYTLASQIVLKSPIKGVIIDAAQILIGSSRFVRGFTYRTRDSIEEWTDDLRYWFSLAEQFAINDYWPMNDTACDKFGGCRFRTICSKSPQVREQFLKSSFTKLAPEDRWNPLKPR